ncbi:MAG: xanthine phosphoribosyltransferase [Clostridia bacterium]|mgnify:CR=1 FL=1|nr:xanthine phosphoribosyltransferase [Clostridia bacterium]
MKELHDAIKTFGRGLGKDVVKVDMFLNHRIDTQLLSQMGKAFAEEFRDERPTLIMTVEASGIAIAVAAAMEMGHLPVVFAKKSENKVQTGDVASAPVYSFTHKKEYNIRVEKRYVPRGSRVLIIDDFLADGKAVEGMMQLCEQLDSQVVGIGIAVEKGFQPGGQQLRARGIHLKSLAIVTGIEDGKILLQDD